MDLDDTDLALLDLTRQGKLIFSRGTFLIRAQRCSKQEAARFQRLRAAGLIRFATQPPRRTPPNRELEITDAGRRLLTGS